MSPSTARTLADLILLTHVGVVIFVVALPPLVWVGALRGWRWVRHFGLRALQLATIAFVVVQTWLGEYCPLTVWESELRSLAGQNVYQRSFIEDWLSRLLFVDAPAWVFVTVYTGFGLLVLFTWWLWPPQRKRTSRRAKGF
jgi:hypothetical protein